jgi:hypothetical protein
VRASSKFIHGIHDARKRHLDRENWSDITGSFGAPVTPRVFHSISLDEAAAPFGAQPRALRAVEGVRFTFRPTTLGNVYGQTAKNPQRVSTPSSVGVALRLLTTPLNVIRGFARSDHNPASSIN